MTGVEVGVEVVRVDEVEVEGPMRCWAMLCILVMSSITALSLASFS